MDRILGWLEEVMQKEHLQIDNAIPYSFAAKSAAHLYMASRRFEQLALLHLEHRNGPELFDLIEQYRLFDFCKGRVSALLLLEANPEETLKDTCERRHKACAEWRKGRGVQLLARNTAFLPVEGILKELSDTDAIFDISQPLTLSLLLVHIYLDAIFEADPTAAQGWHDLQVKLYARIDPLRLGTFLRISTAYSLTEALEVCKALDLFAEMVFILAKMGDRRDALLLILEKLGDLAMAIEFARDQNDAGLWEELLDYARDKPGNQ